MRWLEEHGFATGNLQRWGGVSCHLGQITNQVGDGDASYVEATKEGESVIFFGLIRNCRYGALGHVRC
jgi:hypothetical protein